MKKYGDQLKQMKKQKIPIATVFFKCYEKDQKDEVLYQSDKINLTKEICHKINEAVASYRRSIGINDKRKTSAEQQLSPKLEAQNHPESPEQNVFKLEETHEEDEDSMTVIPFYDVL